VGKRQILLVRSAPGGGDADAPRAGGGARGAGALELEPLGSPREVTRRLAEFNTAPDGTARSDGLVVLHGPGMVVEYPGALEEVAQAVVTLIEEDIAFPVLMRVCKTLGWKMMDPESGRVFG